MASLTLITTPIGNPKDITERARECFLEHSEFYAEDTRKLRFLLDNLGIDCSHYQFQSFHDHNKEKVQGIIQRLLNGEDIFLVSDAGSPIISDPAYPLIQACLESEIEIKTLPGCSSFLAALELSGLPPHPFSFWGFIAREKQAKKKLFSELIPGMSHIFFESPHRIRETLNILSEFYPDYQVCVVRELTKTYESVYRFQAKDFSKWDESIVYKGEFVLLCHIQGDRKSQKGSEEIRLLAEQYMQKSSTKNLSKLLAQCLGQKSKDIYDQLSKKE